MHIRPAQPNDLPTIASISVACFTDDPLYAFTNPGRKTHPLCFRNYLLLRNKIRFSSPGWRYIVAVADAGDKGVEEEGGEVVVGFVVFFREGGEGDIVWKTWWEGDGLWTRLNRTLLEAESRYISLLDLDRSVSHANIANYHLHRHKPFPGDNIIHCQNLCTHPDWQRKGVGGMLIRWGIERAKEEKAVLGLSASPMGTGLYLREGFKQIDYFDAGEIAGGIPVLIWDGRGDAEGKGKGKEVAVGGDQ